MNPNISWPTNISPKEAVKLQKTLRDQIKLTPLSKSIHYIGGADVSINMFAHLGFGGFVTLSYPELSLIDHSVVEDALKFPYIPGLLSFREIPLLLKAWKKLEKKPDLIIVDGVGIAHPRRFGIASHLGLLLNVPTIGCSKKILTGVYEEPDLDAGSVSYIYDKYKKDEIIGTAVRTKNKTKPIFVSPGHLITFKEATNIVLQCVRKHRLIEPTRIAHNMVNVYRVGNMVK